MLKLIDNLPEVPKRGDQQVTILDLSSQGTGLEKRATHEEVQEFVSSISPKPGHTYLHINAMGAGEYYSSNRNADFFPEENLKKYHHTFVKSPAYVYRSHINKDPKRSYGKVIFSVYNDRMHRVELVAECPDELVGDLNDRISMGDYPTTSMATKTPFDTCSICGNVAKSRNEYCTHLRNELNKIYPDGRKVFAVNNGPLGFFDISIVVRPADVTSSILQKVASETGVGGVIGSAELAELEGITDPLAKTAEMKKWSELIKEVSGGIAEIIPEAVSSPKDPPYHSIAQLARFELTDSLTALSDMGISPSLNYLAELITHKYLGEGYRGIGDIVEEFILHVPSGTKAPVIEIKEPKEVNQQAYAIAAEYAPQSSLYPDSIEKRASGVGYAGMGPFLEPTYEEQQRMQFHQTEKNIGFFEKYGPMLLGIGAATLIAKYYITSQIEKQLAKQRISQIPDKGAKIIVIKQASDFMIAAKLSKRELLKVASEYKKNQLASQPGATTPSSTSNFGLYLGMTKKLLSNTKTKIGKKISGLLRLGGIGIKLKGEMENELNT